MPLNDNTQLANLTDERFSANDVGRQSLFLKSENSATRLRLSEKISQQPTSSVAHSIDTTQPRTKQARICEIEKQSESSHSRVRQEAPSRAMSYLLPHLETGWAVDQAILNEGDRVVVMRFGHDHDPTCMQMDEVLCGIAEDVKNFAVIYVVDITQVPDFNTMYELYDPCTVMFFFRNKHIMIDLGTGNNNKINWAFNNKHEMIDIIETVYRGARKGRGLVISPKDYSTKYRY